MFATTSWTLVIQAGAKSGEDSTDAMGELVQRYWLPLYGFARQRGMSQHDAEDATQQFLSDVIEKRWIAKADPAKGRFRTYLLRAWKRFLIDEYRRDAAQKRGGSMHRVEMDSSYGETQWRSVLSRSPDPDQAFVKAWAQSIVDQSVSRLRQSYVSTSRGELFERLIPWVTQSVAAPDLERIAKDNASSSGAIKVALHRLRQRFFETIREVVLETLDDPSELEQELSELMTALSESAIQ